MSILIISKNKRYPTYFFGRKSDWFSEWLELHYYKSIKKSLKKYFFVRHSVNSQIIRLLNLSSICTVIQDKRMSNNVFYTQIWFDE